MSFTKTKYDSCFLEQQQQGNKSIFDYVVDQAMYVNQNECNNYTAPFLTYIPTGINAKSVVIENELKGINRPYTKCTSCKYQPDNQNLPQVNLSKQSVFNHMPNNKRECDSKYNILPQGYIPK
jgi:hypothetical protein